MVSIKQIQYNSILNIHHIPGEKNIDADNLSRGKVSYFSDNLRVVFYLTDIFDQTPLPRYSNNLVHWDSEIHLLQNPFFFFFLGVVFLCGKLVFSSGPLSPNHHMTAAPFILGSMKPITIAKKFLNRTTPPIPLPNDIDEDSNSQSGSWLLLSQSAEDPEVPPTSSTTTVGCQTRASPQLSYDKPRSSLNTLCFHNDTEALSPPSFSPKSKLPRLQYGGLQVPKLHCFESSLTMEDIPETPPTNLFLRIHNSAFIEQHINRIADSLGTGGLLMYVQVWSHWACWCQCHSHPPAEALLSLVLDYLHASDHDKIKKDSKPSRTRMMTHIKALRWIALKLDLPVLEALQSQTVSDFLKSQTRIPFERFEATPSHLSPSWF